jgi:ectoine hydroxylase-related dioxygenase (phytanoyl-CoA dioxygenase family)
MDAQARKSHLKRIDQDGYTVVDGVFDADFAEGLISTLDRTADALRIGLGPNEFEGTQTRRVYNLLAHGPEWQALPVHPAVLPIVDGVLDPGCLISSLSSIDIGPGETPQVLHADDQLIPIVRPHAALVCNSMWALTDFNETNGATRIVPGSHRFDASPVPGAHHESIAAEMPRGSVLIWHGSLWHGGGANHTGERRVGIAVNYCAGFIRQQENQQLGIPREVASTFSPRLRELCGYGVYHHLIGHIEKRSPDFLLGAAGDLESVWDLKDRIDAERTK